MAVANGCVERFRRVAFALKKGTWRTAAGDTIEMLLTPTAVTFSLAV